MADLGLLSTKFRAMVIRSKPAKRINLIFGRGCEKFEGLKTG